MNIIKEQTQLIEITDSMIKESFSDEQREAVKKLDTIPGIGIVSAEQIITINSSARKRLILILSNSQSSALPFPMRFGKAFIPKLRYSVFPSFFRSF